MGSVQQKEKWCLQRSGRRLELTGTSSWSRRESTGIMKFPKRHRLWTVSVAFLALLSFVAGTSFACMQKGVSTVQMAEDCCQSHCQHPMQADIAAECCHSHQTAVVKTLPISPTKVVPFPTPALSFVLIPPAELQSPPSLSLHIVSGEQFSPSPPLYSLYCAFLI